MTKRRIALAFAASVAVATPAMTVAPPAYAMTKFEAAALGFVIGTGIGAGICFFTGWCA